MRGHRVYCSTRGRRGGCGHTFSVMLSGFVRGFIITAGSLWRFLTGVAQGDSPTGALQQVLPERGRASARHLWQRFIDSHSRLRDLLNRLRPPPDCQSPIPAIQTIEHLRAAFPGHPCPLSAMQLHWQTSVFTPLRHPA